MYRLASVGMVDNRILIVESDGETASRMAEDVSQSGGTVAGTVADISGMLAAIDGNLSFDSVMVDAQTLSQAPIFVPEWLADKGLRLVVVTSCDDWYLNDTDAE
jgi:hypothetical protein